MHIPSHMLDGTICPVTAAVSGLGIAAAGFAASKMKDKPAAGRFAAVTGLIFAGQMMNFPIQDGTSGHLLGGVLASALLGVPFGILSIAVVLLTQCLLFSDGGLSVLGANVLNMSLIGAGLGGIIRAKFLERSPESKAHSILATGFAAWFSVVLAAFAASAELAFAGTIPFSKVAPAMLGVHAGIGLGEALITVSACWLFLGERKSSTSWSVALPFSASVLIAALASPFASGFPDGLEWVAEKYQFLHEAAPAFVSPLPDYTVPFLGDGALSTGAAGLVGVLATFLLAWGAAKLLDNVRKLKTVS